MNWLVLFGPLLLAVGLLLLPGLLVALAGGCRGFEAVALAPALSFTALGGGAIAADLLGVPWGWWVPLAAALLLAGLAWCARRLLTRWLPAADKGSWRRDWPQWAAAALGGALWLRHLRNIFDRPDAFSQTFDNVFHLSLVRFFAVNGTGSSITEGGLQPGSGSWFYPAAFHDLASLVLLVFPDSLPIAMTATVWALVTLAWPLGVILLVSKLLRDAPLAVVGSGVLTAAFPGFPILLLEFGVLYPNMLGLILLPSAFALTINAVGLGRSSSFDIGALLLGALLLPGMFLAHPSAVLSLFALALPLLVVKSMREIVAIRAERVERTLGWVRVTLMLACLPVMWAIWLVARPPEAPWDPPISTTDAFGQAALNAPMGAAPAWAASLLVALGVVAAWRRGQAWLVLAWAITVALWLQGASGQPGETRDLLAGVYYNDPFRLAALFTVAAIPLAAVGLDALLQPGLAAWRRRRPSALRLAGPLAVGGLALVLLVLLTQRVPSMNHAVDRASATYALTGDSPLLTTDEMTLIGRVPRHVEPDAVVATNPWNGSSLLYAFTGVETTTKHIFFTHSPELELLNRHLDDAATLREVCPAARTLNVRYALDFGEREVHGARHPFPGLEDLARNRGMVEVDREGDAVLYRIAACD